MVSCNPLIAPAGGFSRKPTWSVVTAREMKNLVTAPQVDTAQAQIQPGRPTGKVLEGFPWISHPLEWLCAPQHQAGVKHSHLKCLHLYIYIIKTSLSAGSIKLIFQWQRIGLYTCTSPRIWSHFYPGFLVMLGQGQRNSHKPLGFSWATQPHSSQLHFWLFTWDF